MIGYSDEAWDSIQSLFDDPARELLADRLNQMLDILENDSGDQRVRRHRMHVPALWHFTVGGSGEVWSILWEPDQDGEPYINFAGTGLAD